MNKGAANFGFLRVAAVVPPLKVADPEYNAGKILELAKKAVAEGAAIIVFPELSVTGYTAADLFQQNLLLEKAEAALKRIQSESKKLNAILIVGLPLVFEGKLFNVAAVLGRGKIYGFVPKTHIPGYKEFYEERWFAASRDLVNKEIDFAGRKIPIGADLLFQIKERPEAILGVEICEDLWVPIPPSSLQVLNGATIIANLSASNDLVGKADYRRSLVIQQSARGICGYIYTSCGARESTTDVVFGGQAMIAENGSLLAESERFSRSGEIIISDLDLEHLSTDRTRTTSFGESVREPIKKDFRVLTVDVSVKVTPLIKRKIDSHPFAPFNQNERNKRAEEIFSIQSFGLAKRAEHSGIKKFVIGVSGGLDSALALLVAAKTCGLLGLSRKNISVFTLPGFATTKRTKNNAYKLAKAIGASFEEIDITDTCLRHFKDIGHDSKTQDLVFQNAQARYRTMILMDKSNQSGGIVVGTGDLSEIALGWNTFTGDQISHYNVNAGVPKTLVKYLVEWASGQKEFSGARKVLKDILATPISPELVRSHKKDITQKTEDLIGPYELHDFFLYHFLRWGSCPKKILFLAERVFDEKYPRLVIKKWLRIFLERFFKNQWKRSVMPDGPKVGSVALSPRGDWRMPSDAEVRIWLEDLD
ncbi:MAG: NAD(+) synthase [Candidatus Harrisonbacteria bacterium RIFCSPLOWO2_02_FULL_41_11]|uniref:Glutamine-dependent NAD(+) synthetase n=1 Tax=Candidatus Harrisonbacteria bacterium RIFCSPHIGHO2_02_FULL_42_16 TaxID=1798404 RepID=A0A1G1ZGM4_9BACT|nr:MAG: NAD(+) synthase [Candidatus Harrisonbacteria bacterium RIFCSPHIGHO2_02_FULL_42_16]OGY66800.1 MAG: NAD(+) synthase [Candidatus Harrisonbacteria bacterium RIFCSPLOWO2_02_FULL_41_11]